jgi:hypothetical protein
MKIFYLLLGTCCLFLGVFFPEFLDPSFGINDFLFSRKERVTLGAYIDTDILSCRFCQNSLTAGTDNFNFFILWMNFFLQSFPPERSFTDSLLLSLVSKNNFNRFLIVLASRPCSA